MTSEPVWVETAAVGHIHRELIAQFGGLGGVRDAGMLESALARPKNLWHHGEGSVFRLAAACAYGIAMNHPFIDGNMRAAFVVSLLFMELNGYSFMAGELECARGFLSLAAGDIDEAELAGWFERWSSPQASE